MSDNKPLVLGVITARGGSKGLPGKNIKILGDKPLIAYSVLVAEQSTTITHTIVSTDDSEIAAIAKKYGADVPFMRPVELANDTATHLDVMKHAIDFMEKKEGIVYDYVVILQPTSPFRLVEDIDKTVELLITTGADSAVTLTLADSHEHPIKMKKLEGSTVIPYCIPEPEGKRRQDLALAYKRSSAVYAMKRNLIMRDNLLFGNKIVGHIVPGDRSIDIDTPLDWHVAEFKLQDLNIKGFTW